MISLLHVGFADLQVEGAKDVEVEVGEDVLELGFGDLEIGGGRGGRESQSRTGSAGGVVGHGGRI